MNVWVDIGSDPEELHNADALAVLRGYAYSAAPRPPFHMQIKQCR